MDPGSQVIACPCTEHCRCWTCRPIRYRPVTANDVPLDDVIPIAENCYFAPCATAMGSSARRQIGRELAASVTHRNVADDRTDVFHDDSRPQYNLIFVPISIRLLMGASGVNGKTRAANNAQHTSSETVASSICFVDAIRLHCRRDRHTELFAGKCITGK